MELIDIMKYGMVQAVLAYVIWGLLPVYWKWFENVPAGEILSHRVVWSFIFVGILIAFQQRWQEIRQIVTNRKALFPLIISGALISVNWLVFIWAVNNEHTVETSLGYYLNPLVNVLLAVIFLRERPHFGQWLAVALAGVGVLIAAIDYGKLPWVSLTLAFSFGLYGLAKKRIKLDASIGLFMETMVIVPAALLYWAVLGVNGQSTAWSLPFGTLLLLLLAGIATGLPLLLFAKAAKHLTLSTLGFVQYIGPSLTLIISVFVFKESVTPTLLISFALIWAALIVYTLSSLRASTHPSAKMSKESPHLPS